MTGSHISEVQQENEALKQQLEMLELQSKQDKEALKVDATQAKEELSRYVCHCEHINWHYVQSDS